MRPTEIGSVYCLESAENWGFLHIPQKSNLQIEWMSRKCPKPATIALRRIFRASLKISFFSRETQKF